VPVTIFKHLQTTMPLIGITGGLATGKSTVTDLFRKHGALVLSADEAARAVSTPGSPVLDKIAEAFGPQFIRADGDLDRAALGAHVFSHPEARHTLDQITHPAILRLLQEQIARARESQPEAVIAVEVPLLYEARMEDWFDEVIVVAIPEDLQMERLCHRSGLTPEEARVRIAAQMPLAEKTARADTILWNTGSIEETARQVDDVWNRISKQ
jgi:dephospho-CoA kinase